MGCNTSQSTQVAENQLKNENNSNAPVNPSVDRPKTASKPASRAQSARIQEKAEEAIEKPASRAQSARIHENAEEAIEKPASRVSTPKVEQIEEPEPENPEFKLNYFDLAGRGEIIRMVFTVGNLSFEDNRINPANWPEIKHDAPLGQLPTLDIKNQPTLVQSLAIARYVAKEAGLAGHDSLEMAKVDAVIETAKELFEEFAHQIGPQLRHPTEEKEDIINEFVENVIPLKFGQLEKLFQLYGSEDYFVGHEITLADLYVYDTITNILKVCPSALEDYLYLQRNREKVEKNEKLEAYMERRYENQE